MSQRPRQPYSHTPYTPCNLSHTGKDAHPHTERGYGLASFFHYCNMWERRGLYIYKSVLKYCIIIAVSGQQVQTLRSINTIPNKIKCLGKNSSTCAHCHQGGVPRVPYLCWL